jgi:hypothetical protein
LSVDTATAIIIAAEIARNEKMLTSTMIPNPVNDVAESKAEIDTSTSELMKLCQIPHPSPKIKPRSHPNKYPIKPCCISGSQPTCLKIFKIRANKSRSGAVVNGYRQFSPSKAQ